MIQSAELRNYQGHKHTSIEFSPGINAIVGSSDSGKSSIIRALLWAYNNRPLGEAFVSYWNRTKKDTIKDETSITIAFDNGAMTRIKTPTRNGYTINDIELGAIGTDVPQEVSALFNITDLNIFNQDDRPFLISESAGEVAKYLNRLVKLDKIDYCLSEIESKKRKNAKDIEDTTIALRKTTALVEKLSWVPKSRMLLEQIEALDAAMQVEKDKAHRLGELIAKCEKAIIEKDMCEAKKKMIRRAEILLSEIDDLREKMRVNPTRALGVAIQAAENKKMMLDKSKVELEEATKDMPELCPTCGRPL
jgi:DNA repair protein SbcC/Rad50